MRNQLAVLDHNYHVDRQYAKDKVTGEDRYVELFPNVYSEFLEPRFCVIPVRRL